MTPSPLPRHRWKVLAAGVMANAAFSVAFSGIPMTAVLMRSGYHLDNAALGLVLGLIGLGIALSELPWGLLTDRWGDRPVLLLGLVATALGLFAMAFWAVPSPSRPPPVKLLGAGLLVVGLLGGSVNGASGRAVMTWFGEGERGLAMSVRQTAVPLGGGIGAFVLPALVGRAGFAAMYLLLAALCGIGAWMAWAWVRDPVAGAARPARSAGPLGDARVWRIVAGIGLLCAPQFAVLSFGSVFLHDVCHASTAAITATMVCVQVGAMTMRVWSGRWTDRHANRPAYLRGCGRASIVLFALLGAACAAGWAPAMPAASCLLLAACGGCVSAWHGVAYTELAALAGPGRAGTALGMANTAVFAVCFLTPLAIPHLLALQGWPLAWWVFAACALVATPWLAPRAALNRRSASLAPAPPAAAPARR